MTASRHSNDSQHDDNHSRNPFLMYDESRNAQPGRSLKQAAEYIESTEKKNILSVNWPTDSSRLENYAGNLFFSVFVDIILITVALLFLGKASHTDAEKSLTIV
jgi:hypothetical protein